MTKKLTLHRSRRIAAVVLALAGVLGVVISNPESYQKVFEGTSNEASAESNGAEVETDNSAPLAMEVLQKIEHKGRAPKTGYSREEFYNNWPNIEGCSLRQRILKREFGETATLADDKCTVLSGEFDEPYTGQHLMFSEKSEISSGVQIDHVVALSDAWQKGAQYLSKEERYQIATDPLNLLAVDASANQGKSDGDAATWLPKNKSFRCEYVARQISVKYKYGLWVTDAEYEAMERVLQSCPNQRARGVTFEDF